MFACLKLKALKFADRALQVKSIPIVEGVEIVKKEEAEDSRHLSEPLVELDEADLPADPEKRQETLDELLIDRLLRFVRSYTLQFSVPKFLSDLDDATGENILQEGESPTSITSPRMAVASSGWFSLVKVSILYCDIV
jgi:hypothetical protein